MLLTPKWERQRTNKVRHLSLGNDFVATTCKRQWVERTQNTWTCSLLLQCSRHSCEAVESFVKDDSLGDLPGIKRLFHNYYFIIMISQNGTNDMLFVLASLACGQNGSKSAFSKANHPVSTAPTVSDISDDETTTTEAASSRKEMTIARRRRRPIKKRLRMGDYQSSSLKPLFQSSSIKPKKSLLETSIDIICNSPSLYPKGPLLPPPALEQDNTNDDASQVDEEMSLDQGNHNDISSQAEESMPTLVNDDKNWKDVHSPLHLPTYLPCPATALKNVKSICLTLEERSNDWPNQRSLNDLVHSRTTSFPIDIEWRKTTHVLCNIILTLVTILT